MAKRPVQSLDRAASLLWLFTIEEPELGVTEIAARTSMHKSTVSRLLASLAANGLVTQNPENRRYHLGTGLLELAGRVLSSFNIQQLARPYMVELATACDETVNLGILERDEVVNIARIPSAHTIRYTGWIGRRNMLHCTSSGKAALAYMPEDDRARFLAGDLPRRTESTITDPVILRAQIEVIRQVGYSEAYEEWEVGVTGVAAPILDRAGGLVAVISISGPTFRIPAERRAEYGQLVLNAAMTMSNLFAVADSHGLKAKTLQP